MRDEASTSYRGRPTGPDYSHQSDDAGADKRGGADEVHGQRLINGCAGADHDGGEPGVSNTSPSGLAGDELLCSERGGAVHSGPSVERLNEPVIRVRGPGVVPRLARVETTQIAPSWNVLEAAFIDVANGSRGRYSVEGMLGKIFNEDWQLWAVLIGDHLQALIGTELSVELSGNRCASIVFGVGDDPKTWVGIITQLEEWAKTQGCNRMEVWARKGWAKYLDEYKLTHVMLERAI